MFTDMAYEISSLTRGHSEILPCLSFQTDGKAIILKGNLLMSLPHLKVLSEAGMWPVVEWVLVCVKP